ncbi:MAG: DNA starvation/stationary phase protection protein Dps [Candidatus Eisenbacteria bacterium]|jgi:starvation-inducible DNA-binding protein|nr:DNA starvation/stationary phase protection protein Dps [Candidatus Eisenbacteria bacterium]
MTKVLDEIAVAHPTRNSLPSAARTQVASLLNLRLADAIDLMLQCKQAHWNVRGQQFHSLHELFDTVYAGVEESVDVIAERIVQMGGTAVGTVQVVARTSEVKEYPAGLSSAHDHVDTLATALAGFASRMRTAGARMTELQDAGTADLCVEVCRNVEKSLWMVEANNPGR